MERTPQAQTVAKAYRTATTAEAPLKAFKRQSGKRTYIRKDKRSWIPNSRTRWTEHLPAAKALDLIEAVNHARTIGLPINWSVVIHFRRGNLKPGYRAQDAIGYFMKAATQWLAKKGVPATFVWFIEHAMGTGEHVHILMHCPRQNRKAFKKLARTKWVQRAGMDMTDRSTLFQDYVGPIGYHVTQSSKYDQQSYLNSLRGYFRYHLKSINPEEALPSVTGDNRPVAEWLKIDANENQPIQGRRASQSQNISKTARDRFAAGNQQSDGAVTNQ
jgi:hypothetical protein